MQINLFNGGLNTRVLPHLINQNEALRCKNVDTSKGSLVPFKKHKPLGRQVKDNIYNFKGKWIDSDEDRDYVEFQERLYYSNGSTRPQWSEDGVNFFNLGLDAPDSSPVVNASSASALTEWEIIKSPKFFTCQATNIGTWRTKYPLPYGEYYAYAAVKHPDYPVYALERMAEKAYFTESYLPSIYFGGAPASGYTDKSQLYVSQESQEKCQAINTYYDPFVHYYVMFGNNLAGLGKVVDITDFKALGKAQYLALWTETESSSKSLEMFEVDFELETANDHIYGLKITKREGYKLELYRNGFKVPITENDEFYFDNPREVQISDAEVLAGVESTNYVYTYYNSKTGLESAPSPSASIPELANIGYVSVSVKASIDPQVDKIRIYRIGGNLSYYTLIAEIDNIDGIYLDSRAESLLSTRILETETYQPAPDGLSFLTSAYAMLFGALGDKLYYSNIGDPFFWDSYSFIDFESDITGIGPTPNGILVFTSSKTYIITGNSPETLSKYLLSDSVGCVLHKSIKALASSIVWLSKEGLYVSSGGSVEALSRAKLGDYSFEGPICSSILNDFYILSLSSGALVVDMRFGLTFTELSDRFKGLCTYNGKMYGCSDLNELIDLFGSEDSYSLDYLSPQYSDGSLSTIKVYKAVYFYSEGEVEVDIMVGSNSTIKQTLQEGYTEVLIPQTHVRGYFIQFGVRGSGTLKEICYTVEERTNG